MARKLSETEQRLTEKKFAADRRRAEEMARKIAAEKRQAERDRRGGK